jgi:ferredoxin
MDPRETTEAPRSGTTCEVTFVGLGRSYRVRRGGTLLRAALRARVPLARACRGDAVCASCRVEVVAGHEHVGPPSAGEQRLAERHPLGPNERYSCQATVHGPVAIRTGYW